MHIETALNAISKWYEGEGHQVICVTNDAIGETDGLDQSDAFISIRGWQQQVGIEGDSFHGEMYFEFEPGKYIKTQFWS